MNNPILLQKIVKLHRSNLKQPKTSNRYWSSLSGLKNMPIEYLKLIKENIYKQWNKAKSGAEWYPESDYIDELNEIDYYIDELKESKENEEKFERILDTIKKIYY